MTLEAEWWLHQMVLDTFVVFKFSIAQVFIFFFLRDIRALCLPTSGRTCVPYTGSTESHKGSPLNTNFLKDVSFLGKDLS